MNTSAIIVAVVIVGIVGIVIGIILGIAGEKFEVEVDPKEEAVLDALPGNNCGACGFAGCSGLAAAIAKGEAPVNACPVGGDPVAAVVGEIMGVAAGESAKMVAYVKCAGDCDSTSDLYQYNGIQDCRFAKQVVNGGPKSCSYGCMGFGTCERECPFDAIHVINGIAVVDQDACKSCEKCVKVCPQNIISMEQYKRPYIVQCDSRAKGKEVMSACKVGCISCHLCEKACEFDAVHVVDNIAYIDQDKCTGCGACAEKCPKKIIKHEIA